MVHLICSPGGQIGQVSRVSIRSKLLDLLLAFAPFVWVFFILHGAVNHLVVDHNSNTVGAVKAPPEEECNFVDNYSGAGTGT